MKSSRFRARIRRRSAHDRAAVSAPVACGHTAHSHAGAVEYDAMSVRRPDDAGDDARGRLRQPADDRVPARAARGARPRRDPEQARRRRRAARRASRAPPPEPPPAPSRPRRGPSPGWRRDRGGRLGRGRRRRRGGDARASGSRPARSRQLRRRRGPAVTGRRPEADRGPRGWRWLRAFWDRAYEENITGLAGMVAYNLVLALFPFALLVLFVFGQVLAVRRRRGERPRRPPAAVPGRRAGRRSTNALERDPRQLDDDRRRRRDRRALDRRLVLGGDGHRVLPHLPRRVPRLGRAEALRAGDAARR